jgi:hypothetical protein
VSLGRSGPRVSDAPLAPVREDIYGIRRVSSQGRGPRVVGVTDPSDLRRYLSACWSAPKGGTFPDAYGRREGAA